MLEKSRVVSQQQGEGNFHVFYQLLCGCDHNAALGAAVQLNVKADYSYLSDGEEKMSFVSSPAVRDLFDELVVGLEGVGVSEEKRVDIFRVVATVLRMGNITFTEDENERCSIDNMEELECVCALAGLSLSEVSRFFITRQFGVRSIITCHLTLAQVREEGCSVNIFK